MHLLDRTAPFPELPVMTVLDHKCGVTTIYVLRVAVHQQSMQAKLFGADLRLHAGANAQCAL
jgi:hypothetical protein